MKSGDLISTREPILQNKRIIWSLLLYFLFKNLEDPNSSSIISFQCILHDSVAFLSFLKFPQIKEGEPNFLGENNSAERPIIWSPLLYLNFKNFSLIWFQRILYDSVVFILVFENFLKLKRPDLISWGKPILQNDRIISSTLFCFSSLKVWGRKMLCHSFYFIAFYMIQ